MKKIVMSIACVVFATSCFSLNSFAIGPADRIERRVDHRDNATIVSMTNRNFVKNEETVPVREQIAVLTTGRISVEIL